jgi:GNAT superfamily N-acetyltransferase
MHIREIDRDEFESSVVGAPQRWLAAARDRICEPAVSPLGRILIAVEEGRIRAVLGLELQWAGDGRVRRATIRVLEVDPEHDRRGIGARLIRFAEGIARVKGCARVHVAPGLERWGSGGCWLSLGYDACGPELAKDITPFLQRGCG